MPLAHRQTVLKCHKVAYSWIHLTAAGLDWDKNGKGGANACSERRRLAQCSTLWMCCCMFVDVVVGDIDGQDVREDNN